MRADRDAPGTAMLAAAAVAFSTAGLFTGLIAADAWTILFWRSFFGGLFLAAVILVRDGAAGLAGFAAMGRPGLLVAGCSTLGTICFVHALRLTTVADVTILFAIVPFVAAVAAWFWMRERASPATLAASAAALLGVVVMMGGGRSGAHLAGNLLALAMAVLIATMMVTIRRHRGVSMLPAACLSAFACALLVLPFARPAAVDGPGFLGLLVFGTVQFGLGLLLLTIGSRRVPAARAALIANLELPLAPLWVWLAFGDRPPAATWAGGAIVLGALVFDLVASRMGRAHGDRRTA